MEKVYGNQYLLATLGSMVERDKAAHTVIFYGEKGSGKKSLARYYAALLLCESPVGGKPCGECSSCRVIEHSSHPDITVVPTSGKLGGYSVETARSVISDAYIKPNNSSGKKVYIFNDCRKVDPRTQNTLLKLIEEPPDYAYFIFTAESKTEFLPTVISRSVCFGTSVCTDDEVREALRGYQCSEEEIESAIGCFHGNIGKCFSYIVDEGLRRRVDLTKSLAESIINKDEYALNKALSMSCRERNEVRGVLTLLGQLVRDAAVISKGMDVPLIGCSREWAEKLSKNISVHQAARINQFAEKAWSAVECNVNITLVMTALSADIISAV